MKALAGALLLVGCSVHSEAEMKHRCEDLGRIIDWPVKLAEDQCWVRCPDPVGWIPQWAWLDNYGCAPRGNGK